jgi:hypothetical protein
MTNGNRVPVVYLLALEVLGLTAISCSQQRSPAAAERPAIAVQLAKTYGLDSFAQVEGIRYTWNGELFGLHLSHIWEWHPKTGTVSYQGKDKEGKPINVTYQRSQLSSESAMVKDEIEPSFVNDNYWLLFPLHAYWDSSANVEDKGMQKLPLGEGSADQVVVQYPVEVGGYTPGDTWTLFVGPDHRVQEFVYHRGGSKKPTVVTATWADYKMAGPLLISTDHRGTADDSPLRIFLTDVAVKMVGSDTWQNAQ